MKKIIIELSPKQVYCLLRANDSFRKAFRKKFVSNESIGQPLNKALVEKIGADGVKALKLEYKKQWEAWKKKHGVPSEQAPKKEKIQEKTTGKKENPFKPWDDRSE